MKVVEFENVYRDFTDGDEIIHALKPCSFDINEGELVAVIGPSGSGKSTMLTLMGGLQHPTGGTIRFRGKNLHEMSEKEQVKTRFDDIGFILQASNLIPYLNIEDQFRFIDKYANRKTDEDELKKTMEYMDIEKRRKLYPSELSGGERQRVAIARAVYNKPGLILADEPTASLDTERAMKVVEMLKNLTKDTDRATVMVTHDERLLKYSDRVFRIIDGNVKDITGNK